MRNFLSGLLVANYEFKCNLFFRYELPRKIDADGTCCISVYQKMKTENSYGNDSLFSVPFILQVPSVEIVNDQLYQMIWDRLKPFFKSTVVTTNTNEGDFTHPTSTSDVRYSKFFFTLKIIEGNYYNAT